MEGEKAREKHILSIYKARAKKRESRKRSMKKAVFKGNVMKKEKNKLRNDD